MIRHAASQSRGQVLSEFALVVPLLLTLILGVIEGGVAVYSLVSLNHATREAARVAVLSSTWSTSEVKTKLRDNAYLLTVPDGSITVSVKPGAGGSSCSTDSCYAARMSGDTVIVTASYTYQGLIAMIFGPGASFAFTARSELRTE